MHLRIPVDFSCLSKINFYIIPSICCLKQLFFPGVTFSLRAFLGSYFASPLHAFPGKLATPPLAPTRNFFFVREPM
jgi:hypothetical protein